MEQLILKFLTAELQCNEIRASDNLFEFGLESMSVMRLVAFLEKKLDINIKNTMITYENFNSINAINNLVEMLLKAESNVDH